MSGIFHITQAISQKNLRNIFGDCRNRRCFILEKTEKYEVEGFLFETKEEAELARKEADAIRYLKKMNNMKNPKVMYQVYEKMISQKLFVTPIGREYLKNLQRQLLGRYEKKIFLQYLSSTLTVIKMFHI